MASAAGGGAGAPDLLGALLSLLRWTCALLSWMLVPLRVLLRWVAALFPSPVHIIAWTLLAGTGMYVSAYVVQRRREREIAMSEERWKPLEEDSQKFVQAEVVSAQWFNLLLKNIWPTYLEQEASHAMAESIQGALDRAVAKLPAIIRSAVQRMELEEFTLGVNPPLFGNTTALFDAQTNYLRFETQLSFVSSGMQAILRPVLAGLPDVVQGLMGRIEISQLSVRGTLRVGLALAPVHPGVKSIDVSFKSMPTVNMRLTPHGAPISDLPALFAPIKEMMQEKLAQDLVDPKRLKIDMVRIFEERRHRQRGGPGGLLLVTVLSGSGIPVSRRQRQGGSDLLTSIFSAGQGSTRAVRTFVEAAYVTAQDGGDPFTTQIFRTPVAAASSHPVWGREFDLALDDPLNKGMHVLRVRIRDIMTGPDPAVIAEEEVDLTKQGIEANGAKQHVWVPLTKLSHLDVRAGLLLEVRWVLPKPRRARHLGGSVHVTSMLNRVPDVPPPSARPGHSRGHTRTGSRAMSGAEALAGNGANGATSSGQVTARGSEGLHANGPLGPLGVGAGKGEGVPPVRGGSVPEGAGAGGVGGVNGGSWGGATHRRESSVVLSGRPVVGIAGRRGVDLRELTAEAQHRAVEITPLPLSRVIQQTPLAGAGGTADVSPSGSSHTAVLDVRMGDQQQVSALVAQVQALEEALEATQRRLQFEQGLATQEIDRLKRKVEAQQQRRLLEEARALTEGAPFVFHSWARSGQVGRTTLHLWLVPRSEILMYGREGVRRRNKKSRTKATVSGKAEAITAREIKGVVLGPELFPTKQGGIFSMLGLTGNTKERQDDQCFSICLNNDTTLNLEIPPEGNGRSREEWVSAIRSLTSGKIADLFGLDHAGHARTGSG